MVSPLLTVIGIFDIVASIMMVWPFPGGFMLIVGLLMLSKSIWSVLSSVSSGFNYDIFGVMDFVGAVVLLMLNFGASIGFAWIIGLIIFLKALYSVYSSLSY